MINIAYVISRVHHSKLFEWTADLLSKEKYRLVFILLNNEESPFEQRLRHAGFVVYRLPLNSKPDVLKDIWKIRSILKKERIDILHTHLFEAGVAGQLAGKLAGTERRIHTRHDAMIHHDSHPGAVKYDKLTNTLATEIIAITGNVKNILTRLEHVPEQKIRVIHHGFQLNEYAEVSEQRIAEVRRKYLGNAASSPVVGVVSRFIDWKGIQYIIPAFRKVLEQFPAAHLLLANAQGPYEEELLKALQDLPPGSYSRIVFESDVAALYKLMDVFVHVPVDERSEAFGQVYIEAMAARVPSVITASGIVPDCVRDHVEAIIVPFRDADAIADGILELMRDAELRAKLVYNASLMVHAGFSIDKMITSLETCYDAQ